MASEIDKLIIQTNSIASFPEIVHRVNMAVDSPRFSLDRVGKIISEDPVLSARLLKIANSSLYGFPVKVDTIARALTLIGTKQLRDLITASMVIDMFNGKLKPLISMESFWRHSIACGVAARVIATARREANVERYYLTGLLHDIGLLVIYAQLPEQATTILQRSKEEKILMCEAEHDLLGFDHAELGGELLRNWNLPPDLHEPVSRHHTPSQSTDYQLEAAIVHVADILVMSMRLGGSGEVRISAFEPASWELIELPDSTVPQIMEHVEIQYQDALKAFLPDTQSS